MKNYISMVLGLSLLTQVRCKVESLKDFSADVPAERTTSEIWESFVRNPHRHSHVPNNSFAGFGYGAYNFYEGNDLVADLFPSFSTVNVLDFGAKGDGETDDTEAVLRALSTIRPGEILYFPEGIYILHNMLRVTMGNVAIKGDGSERSVLFFQKSLSDILGEYWKDSTETYNRWSNHGGLIWIAPGDIWDTAGNYNFQMPTPEGLDIGWFNARTITTSVSPAKRGDTELVVEFASEIEPESLKNKLLVVVWGNDPENELLVHFGGHESFKDYSWETATSLHRDWEWTVEVSNLEQIAGNKWKLWLKQPLRIDVQEKWNVVLRLPESKDPDQSAYIHNFILQGITLKMKSHRAFIHNLDLGFNGVFMQRTFNGFVHDVTIEDADNGIVLESSKCVTIKNTRLIGNEQRHHGYYFRYNVHDCIVGDFFVGKCGYEALSISYRSSGNVFHSGTLQHGSIDSHRGLPFDLIRTNITLESNDGKDGGGVPAGPRNGARVVHWNIIDKSGTGKTVANINAHPYGVLAGIFCDTLDYSEVQAMPKGFKNTWIAGHNQIPEIIDLYKSQFDEFQK